MDHILSSSIRWILRKGGDTVKCHCLKVLNADTTVHKYTHTHACARAHTHTHTHTHLTALFPGLPRWAGTRKVKPISMILLKQQTVSGNGISWAICKSGPRSRQITMPAPHQSVFYRPDALPAANQQRQSCCIDFLLVLSFSDFPTEICDWQTARPKIQQVRKIS